MKISDALKISKNIRLSHWGNNDYITFDDWRNAFRHSWPSSVNAYIYPISYLELINEYWVPVNPEKEREILNQ